MKRFLLLFIIGTIMLSSASYAQTWMIGVRGGLNFASEKYDSLPESQTISGKTFFLAGAQLDFWFNTSLGLSIQPTYVQKGAHVELSDEAYASLGLIGPSGHADWTISYIEIPLLAKWSFGNGSIRPYLFAGPALGLLLTNREVLSPMSQVPFFPGERGNITTPDSTVDITDSTAKLELSIIAGGGVSFNFESGIQLFIESGYSFGLTNIDHYASDEQNDAYIYSRDIRLAAGILFPIR